MSSSITSRCGDSMKVPSCQNRPPLTSRACVPRQGRQISGGGGHIASWAENARVAARLQAQSCELERGAQALRAGKEGLLAFASGSDCTKLDFDDEVADSNAYTGGDTIVRFFDAAITHAGVEEHAVPGLLIKDKSRPSR